MDPTCMFLFNILIIKHIKSLTEREPCNKDEVWWRNLFLCITWCVNHLVEVNESVSIGTEPGKHGAPHNQIVPGVRLCGINWQCHYPYLPSTKKTKDNKKNKIYLNMNLSVCRNVNSYTYQKSCVLNSATMYICFFLFWTPSLKPRTWHLYLDKKLFLL